MSLCAMTSVSYVMTSDTQPYASPITSTVKLFTVEGSDGIIATVQMTGHSGTSVDTETVVFPPGSLPDPWSQTDFIINGSNNDVNVDLIARVGSNGSLTIGLVSGNPVAFTSSGTASFQDFTFSYIIF